MALFSISSETTELLSLTELLFSFPELIAKSPHSLMFHIRIGIVASLIYTLRMLDKAMREGDQCVY